MEVRMALTAENIDLVTTTIAENKNDKKTEESEEEKDEIEEIEKKVDQVKSQAMSQWHLLCLPSRVCL